MHGNACFIRKNGLSTKIKAAFSGRIKHPDRTMQGAIVSDNTYGPFLMRREGV
jgi:hypothetical protein